MYNYHYECILHQFFLESSKYFTIYYASPGTILKIISCGGASNFRAVAPRGSWFLVGLNTPYGSFLPPGVFLPSITYRPGQLQCPQVLKIFARFYNLAWGK